MFKKILVANRGEIAVRIMKTCRRMGIGTVAVYSEVDAQSLHRSQADEALYVGGSPSRESYLRMERILELAVSSGCEAVHPGYGFLSENADFARLTREAGLVFIGPSPSAITTLGDKLASKNLAVEAGVPVVPGSVEPLSGLEEAASVAERIGTPFLLKAVHGGGGKGMRIVSRMEEMQNALAAAQSEARKAFGNDQILVERYIPNPRHVEVQVLADHHGNIIHLGERECSIQRRYQKIIEETPSTAVEEPLREEMGRMACALARQADYTNAGTVEFILDRDGKFYFLEMNTRLQVEHPVTERVTSVDLVELQIRIASGEPLPLKQEDVSFRGWAIEVRVCAEDPERGFLPSTGMITRYYEPRGPAIRVDSGVEAGSIVSSYYDSLLAKVIAWGEDREEARASLIDGLNGYHIEGVNTNVTFANAILTHPSFAAGELSTGFIEEHFEEGQRKIDPPAADLHYMALAATLVYHNRQNLVRASLRPMAAQVGGAVPSKPRYKYIVRGGKDPLELALQHADPTSRNWDVWVDGRLYHVTTPPFEFYRRRLKLEIDGSYHRFLLQYRGNFIRTTFSGTSRTLEIYTPLEWNLTRYVPTPPEGKAVEDHLPCPMPGIIVDVQVQPGERVYKGQQLLIIESMKMESGVASPYDAVVKTVLVESGQAVETGDTLLVFDL
jgi:propionyl-CoA carboxylase alpha chain